jgi:toxin FitB
LAQQASGLALLVPGQRRNRLSDAFDRAIDEILDGRVLPFDRAAAETAVAIAAKQRQIGRSVEIRDVQIAGIIAARKATLATPTLVTSKTLASFSLIPGALSRRALAAR